MTRPSQEEDLPEGGPPAVDADHWAALKQHYRADSARMEARRRIIEAAEEGTRPA